MNHLEYFEKLHDQSLWEAEPCSSFPIEISVSRLMLDAQQHKKLARSLDLQMRSSMSCLFLWDGLKTLGCSGQGPWPFVLVFWGASGWHRSPVGGPSGLEIAATNYGELTDWFGLLENLFVDLDTDHFYPWFLWFGSSGLAWISTREAHGEIFPAAGFAKTQIKRYFWCISVTAFIFSRHEDGQTTRIKPETPQKVANN